MMKSPYIERVGLDLDGVSDEQRRDLWADVVRPLFDVSLLNADVEPPVERADAWLMDNLLLTKAAFGSQIFDRSSKHLKADVADCLLFQIYLSGEVHGETGGETVHIRPGDLHIQDFSRPHRARATQARVLGIVVSHDLVGYDRDRHPAVMHVPRDGAVGRVLRSTVLSVFRQIETTTKAEQAAIAGGLIGLLRGALFSPASLSPPSLGIVAARSRAIRDYIVQNLRSEHLTADAICSKFGLSRATLYRDFQAEGGLERYITARRLDAALMNLAVTDTPRGAVNRVAEAWRFSSSSHFIREFQRKFGFSPGSVAGAKSRVEAPSSDGDRSQSPLDAPDLLPLLRKL